MAVGLDTLAEITRPSCARIRPAGPRRNLKIHVWAPAFEGFGGGICAFSRELALALQAVGHQVRLSGKADRAGMFEGMQLFGSGARRDFQTVRFASGCMAGILRDRPDQIVTTHVNLAPVAHLAKRAMGIPFAVVAHGIDVHSSLPSTTLRALRAADRVMPVSDWTKRRVLDLGGIDERKVFILHNTFDESRFKDGPRPQALADRYAIADDERVILTVARLSPGERYKGYDRIVRALPSLQRSCGPVRFILVGKGNDRGRVETLAKELGVERSVTFTGFVPDDELADHYRLADVFAMPSTGEGFGIVFLESLGCGTPVVAGNRDGSVDAVDGGALGKLVDPEDIDAIASGIRSVLDGEGPATWFDRARLRTAVVARFGRAAYRERVATLYPASC